jgi:sortase A
MERFDTRKTATKKTVMFGFALLLAALLLLAAYAGLGRPASGEASQVISPDGETVSPPEIPDDDTLLLIVPAMARVKDLPVGTGPADDEATLAESALHVEGTGFPWEEGANVYRSFVVGPSDYHVTEPVARKSAVGLQTCTLPDYSERLVVQAELADVSS